MIQREPVSKAADAYSFRIFFCGKSSHRSQEVAFSSVKGYKVPTKFAPGEAGIRKQSQFKYIIPSSGLLPVSLLTPPLPIPPLFPFPLVFVPLCALWFLWCIVTT